MSRGISVIELFSGVYEDICECGNIFKVYPNMPEGTKCPHCQSKETNE